VWYGINGSIVDGIVDLVALCYIALLCSSIACIVDYHGLLLSLSSATESMVACIVNYYGLLLSLLSATESMVACIVNYYGLLYSLWVVIIENLNLCSTT